MTHTEEIRLLFDTYLTAWNARDFAGVAACYTEPSLFVMPSATVPVPDQDAMISLLENIFAGLDAQGFSHSEIGEISARTCSDALAIVDAKNVARLRADGSALEVIDAHYVVRKSEGAWKFVSAVVCDQGWQDD